MDNPSREDAGPGPGKLLEDVRRSLERGLVAIALVAGGVLIVVTFERSITGRFPESIVFLVRHLAVGVVVAAVAAVLVPRLLKQDELRDIVLQFVKKDVRRAIDKQTARIKEQTKTLYEGAASLGAMQDAGITRVYTSRRDADADMATDLARVHTSRRSGAANNLNSRRPRSA